MDGVVHVALLGLHSQLDREEGEEGDLTEELRQEADLVGRLHVEADALFAIPADSRVAIQADRREDATSRRCLDQPGIVDARGVQRAARSPELELRCPESAGVARA